MMRILVAKMRTGPSNFRVVLSCGHGRSASERELEEAPRESALLFEVALDCVTCDRGVPAYVPGDASPARLSGGAQ